MQRQRLADEEGRVYAWRDARGARRWVDGDPQPFRVEISPERERVRVLPVGDLDLASAPLLGDRFEELLEVGFEWLVLDLRRVSFVDCAGVRALCDARSGAARRGVVRDWTS